MPSIIRCLRAEFLKCKHSPVLYLHLLVPIIGAVVFAGYFRISSWNVVTEISAYLEVLAVAFPFLIGIIIGMIVQIENQAGHFQLMLGTIPSRSAAYIGKLAFLLISAMGATVLALGTFCMIYGKISLSFYIKAWLFLIATILPLYLIYLFIGMRFGKGACMGLGIAGSLISALMITGLGDAVWKYIPWAWSVRTMDYLVLAWNKPDTMQLVQADFATGIWIAVLFSICSFVASLIWFRYWEGGKNND
ncbi:MAG: lantibiotic immunity ABC transporter MutG family permease subunit [Lachnospiraceae bacterium]|nr:lantibiotic immunity ABC transporter MutG family permease subunit [Lachnospiraceae bacterium]